MKQLTPAMPRPGPQAEGGGLMRKPTVNQKIDYCRAEAGELEFQAKNHRSFAQNGADTPESIQFHLDAANYKEEKARLYRELAAKLRSEKQQKRSRKGVS